MINNWTSLCAAACVFALAGTARAAHDVNTSTSARGSAKARGIGQLASAHRLVGFPVMTTDNQRAGKIDNVVLDLESGRILYMVVDTGSRDVAVPPQMFGPVSTAAKKDVRMRANRQQLESAPEFTRQLDDPNRAGQAAFVSQVYQHFGQPAWWQGASGATAGSFNNVHKADKITGMEIKNVTDQTLGKVHHAVLDVPAGRVVYIILAPDRDLKLGDALYVLPPNALTLHQSKNYLVTDASREKLAAAPHFPRTKWPNLASTAWGSKVYEHFGKQPYFSTGSDASLTPTGRDDSSVYPDDTRNDRDSRDWDRERDPWRDRGDQGSNQRDEFNLDPDSRN